MRKILLVTAATLALAGCSEYSRSDRTLGGAAIGAGSGALIGGLATNSTGGAVVGGVLGGVAGAMVGSATTPKACRVRDRWGRLHAVECP